MASTSLAAAASGATTTRPGFDWTQASITGVPVATTTAAPVARTALQSVAGSPVATTGCRASRRPWMPPHAFTSRAKWVAVAVADEESVGGSNSAASTVVADSPGMLALRATPAGGSACLQKSSAPLNGEISGAGGLVLGWAAPGTVTADAASARGAASAMGATVAPSATKSAAASGACHRRPIGSRAPGGPSAVLGADPSVHRRPRPISQELTDPPGPDAVAARPPNSRRDRYAPGRCLHRPPRRVPRCRTRR